MERKSIILFLIIAVLSSGAFCSQAGTWGVSANSIVGNISNVEIGGATSGGQAPFPSLFYQITDRFSADMGFSSYSQSWYTGIQDNVTASYFKVLYNLGDKGIIPHVGLKLVNMSYVEKGNALDSDNYSDHGTLLSLIAGLEIPLSDKLTVLTDLDIYSNDSLVYGANATRRSVSLVFQPLISVRWYL
jgi:hypothetical protein